MNTITKPKGTRSLAAAALLTSAACVFAQTEGLDDDFENATTIPPTGVTTEQVYPVGDIDTYRFTLTESKIFTAGTSGQVDTFGCLFSESRSLVTMASGGGNDGNFHLSETLQPGSYYLQVSSFSAQDTGEYDLNLQLADIPSGGGGDDGDNIKEAAPHVDINSVSGSSLTQGDVDYFRITIFEPQTLTLSSTGSTDTVGELVDAAGAVIASNDDGGTSFNFEIERALGPGTYYARVSGYSSSTTGAYILHVDSSVESTRTIEFVGEQNFGNVEVGTQRTSQIWIANSGNVSMDVDSVRLPDGFSGFWPSRTLAPRTRMPVNVTFSPMTPGDYSGMLDVTADTTAGATQAMLTATATSATDPSLNDEYHEATYVSQNGTVTADIAATGQMFRYDASEDMVLNLSGLSAGAVNLQSASGAELSTAEGAANFALTAGTYYIEVLPELAGSYDLSFTAESAPALEVASIETSGATVTVAFQSQAGKSYQLEYSADLSNWDILQTFDGTGTIIECNSETSARNAGYYRVTEVSQD